MPEFEDLLRRAGRYGPIELDDDELAQLHERHPRARWRTRSFYNVQPPNLVQIDAEEWVHHHVYRPTHAEFRQFEGASWNLEWFHDGTGTAFSHQYLVRHTPGIKVDEALAVRGTRPHMTSWSATFWRFAVCWHTDVVTTNPRMCLHRYTCNSCGYRWEVDSSD